MPGLFSGRRSDDGEPHDHLGQRATVPIKHTDRFFIGGEWVTPSSDSTITVIDSHTEQDYLTVAEAQAADIDRAVTAAKEAFDNGPWPRLSHAERAAYLRALGDEVVRRSAAIVQMWPREAGTIAAMARRRRRSARSTPSTTTRTWPTLRVGAAGQARPAAASASSSRSRSGVVGAIIPWNAPMGLISMKLAPALIAGCTVGARRLARGAGRGLHHLRSGRGGRAAAGRAQRDLRRPRGLRAAGSRPAGRQDHLHRLHRRRAAHRLDLRRADRPGHPGTRRQVGRRHPRRRGHRDHRQALAAGRVHAVRAGAARRSPGSWSPGRATTRCSRPSPRRSPRSRSATRTTRRPDGPAGGRAAARPGRGLHRHGIEGGATLATGGGRPKDLDRGWYIEPTVFGNVDNSSVIAQEEIFGPVLSVIPADDEARRGADRQRHHLRAARRGLHH